MQPYFFPYAGYFRLFLDVDEFVIFDCVQFPRRGRVHRTEVTNALGVAEWLTLPLSSQPRDVRICDLRFAKDARIRLDRRLEEFPWWSAGKGPAADRVRDFLHAPPAAVIDCLEAGLRLVNELLCIDTPISRSSSLGLDSALRGQDRVLAVARFHGATHYLNAPGGKNLYDPADFERAGIELEFLPPYQGEFFHMLQALVSVDPMRIREDIELAGTRLPPA
jgi:hypothetical protein